MKDLKTPGERRSGKDLTEVADFWRSHQTISVMLGIIADILGVFT